MAIVLDFFEWKFNKRIVVVKRLGRYDRLKEYLEMELVELLRKDSENTIINNPTDT